MIMLQILSTNNAKCVFAKGIRFNRMNFNLFVLFLVTCRVMFINVPLSIYRSVLLTSDLERLRVANTFTLVRKQIYALNVCCYACVTASTKLKVTLTELSYV